MSGIEDVMADLSDNAARDWAAAAFLRRLGAFLDAEEARGFAIEADVAVVGSGVLRVELGVRAPAGEVDAPQAVELVEGAAPELPTDLAPAAEVDVSPAQTPPAQTPPAQTPPAQIPPAQPEAPAPKQVPARWTEDEDATAVELAASGATVREIADRLGRPELGTGYRLRKVLKERIAAARSSGVADDGPEPDPVPEPVANDAFTAELDAKLRKYMAEGMGLGGAAAVLRMPRDKVAARWTELQAAGAA